MEVKIIDTGINTFGVNHLVEIAGRQICLAGKKVGYKVPNHGGSAPWLHDGTSGEAIIIGLTHFPMRGKWAFRVAFLNETQHSKDIQGIGYLLIDHCTVVCEE